MKLDGACPFCRDCPVVNAERDQVERIERLVQTGAYASISAFMREAVDEKLERLREARGGAGRALRLRGLQPRGWRSAGGPGLPGIRTEAACVYTVWKRELDAQLGTLPGPLMAKVDRALALVLALPALWPAND